MNCLQREWNKTRGGVRQMWKAVHRMLRTEGIDDVMEEKQQYHQHEYFGRRVVSDSIRWNNQLGMNLPEQE
ncbi:hypothetical protein BLNAU_6829 [Blattamonas nauphoetae]|uniref:Uncharacterized protein n=1 Tax=Blattamonas nauphoetae TaxID=2049346 RepID=A0ABQ9Y310_9EUKA|nr:hypothetical protein BLNAU_6829 [Blattamonas nauphoetae]